MTSKAELASNQPTISQLQQVASGELITAEVENANNLLNLNAIILAYNWIVDNGADLTLENVYTVAQEFSLGIKTNLIEPLTADTNIVINNGTGGVYKNSVTSNNKILTQAEVAALITSGSDVVDRDYGDITVSTTVDPGDTWTIDNGAVTTAKIADANVTLAKMANDSVDTDNIVDEAVTLAKIQNLATGTLLGNSTGGSAVPEEVAIGSGLLLDSGELKLNRYTTAADQSGITHTAEVNITGLSFTPAANTTYLVTVFVSWVSSVPTANGARIGVGNITALAPLYLTGIASWTEDSANAAMAAINGSNRTALAANSIANGNVHQLSVMFRTDGSPGGDFNIVAQAETASATVEIKAGSSMLVEIVG
jgi:hypothetical protein